MLGIDSNQEPDSNKRVIKILNCKNSWNHTENKIPYKKFMLILLLFQIKTFILLVSTRNNVIWESNKSRPFSIIVHFNLNLKKIAYFGFKRVEIKVLDLSSSHTLDELIWVIKRKFVEKLFSISFGFSWKPLQVLKDDTNCILIDFLQLLVIMIRLLK